MQLIKENWPTLTSSPRLTATKYWIPPFCPPPTKISIKKKKFPHKRFLWSFGPSPLFTKGEGRKLCGKTERNERAGSCILAVKRKGEFECICQKRKICVVSERSGSCILNIFIRSMFKTRNTMEKGHIFFFGFWLELLLEAGGRSRGKLLNRQNMLSVMKDICWWSLKRVCVSNLTLVGTACLNTSLCKLNVQITGKSFSLIRPPIIAVIKKGKS